MSLERVVGSGFEPGCSNSSRKKALKTIECINLEEIYCFSVFYFMWNRTLIFLIAWTGIYFKRKTRDKNQNPSAHMFFLFLVSLWMYTLDGEEVKETSFPWPVINLQTSGCYKLARTLKPYYDHYKLTGPLHHSLARKSGLIGINHRETNKRKGSAKRPLSNPSPINGFSSKGNETRPSGKPESIVAQCWIFCEMVRSWWSHCVHLHSISTSFLNLPEILLPLRNPDILQIAQWTLNDFWNKNEVIFTAILNIPAVKGAFMDSFITARIDFFS